MSAPDHQAHLLVAGKDVVNDPLAKYSLNGLPLVEIPIFLELSHEFRYRLQKIFAFNR